jgi:hypothetical protein
MEGSDVTDDLPTDGSQESEQELQFALEGLDDIPLHYTTEVSISVDHFGLHFVFGQLTPPPYMNETDRRLYRERGYIPLPVVARIAVPPALAEYLLAILPERIATQRRFAEEYQQWLDRNRTDAAREEQT